MDACTALYSDSDAVCDVELHAFLAELLQPSGAASPAAAPPCVGTWRCVEPSHAASCTECVATPAPGQEAQWALLGAARGENGFKALRRLVCARRALDRISLTTGLCLDYDILLLDAVAERLAEGDAPSDAVDEALVATGGTISFAGAILTAAFTGFLAGKVPLLNQLGYFIVGAVLLFVFVIRPLLTASLLHVLGRWAWWPIAVPLPQPQQHAASAKSAEDNNTSTSRV